MISAEEIESRLQRLQIEQALILDQVDNAIALFDCHHRLILFNQKLAQMWDLTADWLTQQPSFHEVFTEITSRGGWQADQRRELEQAIAQTNPVGNSFSLIQPDGICLEVYTTATSEGGLLFNFRDVTVQRQAQANLNAEVRRLTFLLGLTERLQTSEGLREIGQFALTYLVQAMGAAFGDVKVVTGAGGDRKASALTNQISGEFIATYGTSVVSAMEGYLNQGIPYGQGLLWAVVETGQPKFVEDYANHPKAVESFRHPGIGQLGIFPIPAADGSIIGVLTLESRNLQKLQEAPQQDMLQAACRTLGAAIERARSEEQLRCINANLEQASRLKSEFLASMSHELRTPLNSILGFAELLQRQTSGSLSDRQIRHVQAIERSGHHLLQLINEILDLSKVEAGKVELDLRPVSVQDLCRDCLRMIQPTAEKKRLALSIELDYRLDRVNLDERRVRQMIVNLLSNAAKFTPETGAIKLSGKLAYGRQLLDDIRPDRSPVNSSTPYLCLEVMDSGIGIPLDKQHLLFQPFQQIDASLNRRHDGTGLGLALTKRLAELHGGTVSFQSTEGQGSIFRIWLPLTEMRHALQEPSPTHAEVPAFMASRVVERDPGAQRILVVEDQPYNQALISEFLELEGFLVELIVDGKSMSEAIASDLVTPQTLPNLILMDIQLPGVNGFELIKQLKAHPLWRQVPVIVVTAMAMAGDRDRCFAAGADAYLSKPLDLDQVLSNIRLLLRSQSSEPHKSQA
jgi:signal transduction histidine kinase/ActR/RegA family two-component response regulator